ncbi:MAG: GNAT family N-acetyltransferase [Melioribacteraceae bacterium]|nr:GNAT family N-acetyltransferase [Melioribacteraceae bacterium]
MNEQLKIRIAGLEDADTIKEFNKAMALETEEKQLDNDVLSAGVKSLLNNPQYGFYLVAEKDDKVVGCLMITTEWSDWRNGLFWWIQSVYVDKNYRRQGIYKSLYNYVKELADSKENICGFRLYVENENVTAQKTYESLGMKLCYYKMYEEIK